jgi:hypothetical protein
MTVRTKDYLKDLFYAGAQPASTTWYDLIDSACPTVFNVQAYGAVGDGETDDAEAIQDAITALETAGGGVLVFPFGTYLISDALVMDAAVPYLIEGNGSTIVRAYSSYDAEPEIVYINNVASKNTTVTAAITAGDIQLTVADSADMAIGDMILLESNEVYSTTIIGTYGKGFGSIITKIVSSTAVEIADPVPYAFSVTDKTINVKVYAAGNLCAVRDLNLKWTGAHNNTTELEGRGLLIMHRLHALVENIRAENCSQAYLQLVSCVGAEVRHVYGALPQISDEGYGLLASACYSCRISHLDITTSRHTVALSGSASASGPCWNVRFDHCNLRSLGYSLALEGVSFDAHCAERVYISDSYLPNGIKFGGGYLYVDNCYISNVSQTTGGFGWVVEHRNTSFQKMVSLHNCTIKTVAVAAGSHFVYGLNSSYGLVDVGDFEMINCVVDVATDTDLIGGDWTNITSVGTWRFEGNVIKGKIRYPFGSILSPSAATTGRLFFVNNTVQYMGLDEPVYTSTFTDIQIIGNRPLQLAYDATHAFWIGMTFGSGQTIIIADNVCSDFIRCSGKLNTTLHLINNTVLATSWGGIYTYAAGTSTVIETGTIKGTLTPSVRYTTNAWGPDTGSARLGDIAWWTAPASGSPPGWICTHSGTFSDATDSTGDTDGSTAVITGMADTSDFAAGDYVDVSAGFATTGPYKILSKTSSTITLEVNSNAVASNITVNTSDPTWTAMANLA